MRLLRRTRAAAFLVVAFALAAGLFFALRLVRGAIDSAVGSVIDDGAASVLVREIGEAFAVAAFGALLIAAAAAAAAGWLLARPLGRLREDTLARTRDDSHPITKPPIDEQRGVAGAVALLDDERRRRIERLERERDELALLVGSVSEGIVQLDADGRIVRANPASQMLLGIPAGAQGQHAAALIRHAELRSLLERAAAGHGAGSFEINLDERRLLVAARPLPAEDGGSAGAVVAFTDLTEVRRLEGVRRDFVANVSHELKTPLTSIRGYVETLLSDDLPDEMQRQFLDVVHKNAERLHRIVDDLLDLSRLESGGWRPELQTVDARAAAEDAWTAFRESADRKRIDGRVEGEHAAVLADPAGLRQVLANLLDNAIRYTAGSGRVVVRVQRPEGGPWVILEVEDNGVGIPHDALGRIFERFYRVDPARSRAAGGTGLGLSIVKHLVERMGGDVAAHSVLGKGTTIRVRLPAATG
jgi:two-component system, OmpR family, phosphate regulon sensor histidine kinase PhoR